MASGMRLVCAVAVQGMDGGASLTLVEKPHPTAPPSSPRSLVRQQEAVIDGGGIAHSHYLLRPLHSSSSSEEGGGGGGVLATDELWVGPAANWQKGVWDEEQMLAGMQQLMARTLAPPVGREDGGRQLTLDFLIGAKAIWQQQHVRQYFSAEREGGGSGGSGGDGDTWQRRTLLVLSLCVWEQTKVFPT